MKHTTRDWKLDFEYNIVDSKGNIIANIPWSKEYEANAKLIAKSPKMDKALKKIFDKVNLANTSMELYKEVESLIKE